VILVAAEVGEPLLVVPEPFEELVGKSVRLEMAPTPAGPGDSKRKARPRNTDLTAR